MTYTLLLNGTLQWFIQRNAQIDDVMTSLQRAFQYVDLAPELDEGRDEELRESWPEYGLLTFESASFSHHASLPFVLRKIFLAVRPYEKVFNFMFFYKCIVFGNHAWILLDKISRSALIMLVICFLYLFQSLFTNTIPPSLRYRHFRALQSPLDL